MSTALSSLLLAARTNAFDAQAKTRLEQQICSVAAYTTPDSDDIRQALHLGSATTLATLFKSPRLPEDQRKNLATGCLLEWSSDPFSFNVREPILDTLLWAGAQVDAPDYRGQTAQQKLVGRLNEFRKRETGRARESGATTQLRQWVASMDPRPPTRVQVSSNSPATRPSSPSLR